MNLMKPALLVITGILIIFSLAACSGDTASTTISTTTTATTPAAVVNSDSIVTGMIQSVRTLTTGFLWELKLSISSSQNVGDLPNPTGDKVGQVLTLKTDQDLALFTPGQLISANVKYAGDIPQTGIILYASNIQLQ